MVVVPDEQSYAYKSKYNGGTVLLLYDCVYLMITNSFITEGLLLYGLLEIVHHS